jgi:hypothetical protein
MRHPHYDVIVAWAEDPKHTIVQYLDHNNNWQDCCPGTNISPSRFEPYTQYRIKPNESQVEVKYGYLALRIHGGLSLLETDQAPNVELTFDPLNNSLIGVKLI